MDFTNPLIYGVPCFLGLILVELTYSKHHDNDELYHWKDLGASLTMGIGSTLIAPLIKTVTVILLFNWVYDIFNPVVDGVRTNIFGWESFGYAWYFWILCQLADDFSYYWFHRQNHMVRFFWAAHIVHHSSENFNLGTAVRNGWFTIFYKPLFYIWIVAIGFPPEMLVVCLGIEALWQFQLHSQYVPKLGIIDKIFNTHTMHQVHHARNLEYMDKNHGGFLNIFDRMFGTFKELDEEIEIEYGVTKSPDSYNPLVILTHEYKDIWKDMKRSPKLKHKFMYAFGPPGWSHDGSTLTIKQMRQKLKEERVQQQKQRELELEVAE
ncbi:sterol desaturase family protein [Leeuwenhoekiella palythoae]|uniref:Sterol desaturase/sphingolipid hydroxylase (Fatty acid hydroxylase superfamily) n=1 Tax=Leeuwenhoekiella palythoae TaxID=573501 RepID=A0A1M5T6N5_9FLAO|nr:sterol desaturase family protein [Leeuwenhoekiella palythoae]RXG28752.1 sterol desaturase/sphingolipid hydroxylase (fatty acid hydroxylase superfamily) [Leeuwenhoekiella palythoae]SHH46372.1 Sterol desaturase/sphingolipid hydroxylase, fatty acid hydroxylase superfamily [Leeuwenhoekiella palythoae]